MDRKNELFDGLFSTIDEYVASELGISVDEFVWTIEKLPEEEMKKIIVPIIMNELSEEELEDIRELYYKKTKNVT